MNMGTNNNIITSLTINDHLIRALRMARGNHDDPYVGKWAGGVSVLLFGLGGLVWCLDTVKISWNVPSL